MMRGLAITMLLLLLTGGAPCALAYRLRPHPPGSVKVLVRHSTLGAASPGGRLFAFLKHGLVIQSTRSGRTLRRLRVKHLNGLLAWSAKGRSIAFGARDWRRRSFRLYRYWIHTRRLQLVTHRHVRQFVFTPRGQLVYLTGDGAYLARRNIQIWRAGASRPFLRLPNRGLKRRGHRQRVRLHRRYVLTVAPAKGIGHAGRGVELWLTKLSTGRARRVLAGTRADSPVLSPAEDLLCYITGPEVRCIHLASGRDRMVVRSLERCDLSFGPKQQPFSPNGRLLAIMGCAAGSRRHLMIHDFETGLTRTLLESTRFKGFCFQGNQHVVLTRRDHWPLSYRYPRAPWVDEAVARINVETGAYEVLVADDAEYQLLATAAGNPHVLYLTRERDSTADLVRADVSRTWRRRKPRRKVRNGRFVQYHANGRPKLLVTYRNGKAHGKLARWYWSGHKLETGQYRDGLPVGLWTTYDPQGRRFIERTLVAGKTHGLRKVWYRNSGRVTRVITTFSQNAYHGRQTYFGHNGRRLRVCHWRHNRKDGRWTTFDPNGRIKEDGSYLNGKKHGTWRKRGSRGFRLQLYRHGRRIQ